MNVEDKFIIAVAGVGGALVGGICAQAGLIYGASTLVLETSLISGITAAASEAIRQNFSFKTKAYLRNCYDIAPTAVPVCNEIKAFAAISAICSSALIISHLALKIFTLTQVALFVGGALSISALLLGGTYYYFPYSFKNPLGSSE